MVIGVMTINLFTSKGAADLLLLQTVNRQDQRVLLLLSKDRYGAEAKISNVMAS